MRNRHNGLLGLAAALWVFFIPVTAAAETAEMDELWGESSIKMLSGDAGRGRLFEEGNYAMFIHWGLYSHLANEVHGKTYYGIGEWIMDRRMAGIPPDEYKRLAGAFNPTEFDAMAIAGLAKDAGMKYIVMTAKHHDGFAMYDSDASAFNIVDASPFARDPLRELSDACREVGLGFGFYYSHNQDWTFPGGRKGPTVDADGVPATFDDYFHRKCLPQVEELTTRYGPIEIVWFDTPGGMKKEYVEELVDVVRRNQPGALISGRAGYDLGDYQTLGDMEVPHQNVDGLWESVDTMNDSWAFAWYDQNWKTPREILHRLIACVGRGGTYMLNIGPRGDGKVPERAARSLREVGEWIRLHPRVVYGADPSPWGRALPWGDVTVNGNRLFLSVFDWPSSGRLFLPGLKTAIEDAQLLDGTQALPIAHEKMGTWTILRLPPPAPGNPASVVELTLAGDPVVDTTFGIDPNRGAELLAEFASVEGAKIIRDRWMEKFGEWVLVHPASNWQPEGRAIWEVNVLVPGDYDASLTYAGKGRLVWGVEVVGGERIQNQQNSSHNYQEFPIGWVNFPAAGRYKVAVSCLEGDIETARLKALRLTPLGGSLGSAMHAGFSAMQ